MKNDPPSRWRRWARAVLAAACGTLAVFSAVRLARFVEAAQPVVAGVQVEPPPPVDLAPLSAHERTVYRRHQVRGLSWKPALATHLGDVPVAYAAAVSHAEPMALFAPLVADDPARPMTTSIRQFPGGVALTRIESVDADGARLGPTSVVLAFAGPGHWAYVTLFFPRGLALSALELPGISFAFAREAPSLNTVRALLRSPSTSGAK